MNRRGFLGTLLGGAALVADPERLLWTPGKKLISIPKPVIHEISGAAIMARWRQSDEYLNSMYLRPAAEALARAINFKLDRWIAENGARDYLA